ncbi:MAG TPA: hypothetical protein VFY32_03710 [Solirubrobacteraceae bacterium]|nr:hypothetical protein [Solirubrobacteraceae bacterium]
MPASTAAACSCSPRGGRRRGFLRDRVEQGSVGGPFVTAGIEAMAVVACFLVLGPALGLFRR